MLGESFFQLRLGYLHMLSVTFVCPSLVGGGVRENQIHILRSSSLFSTDYRADHQLPGRGTLNLQTLQ